MDELIREKIRAAWSEATPMARSAALRACIRGGMPKAQAEVEVCGMTSDALLGWKHSRTSTVHLALQHDQAKVEHESLGTVSRAPCGAHGPHHNTGQVEVHPDSNYMVNTWAMDEIPKVDWVRSAEVTCKTCRYLAFLDRDDAQKLQEEWARRQARVWQREAFACLVGECGPGDESTCLDCAPLKHLQP